MSSSDVFWIFADLNRYSGVPAILFFLFFIRKWKSDAAIIFYIVLISFLFDFFIYIYIKHFYPNSYFGSNWWIILNYFLMSWFFIRVLPHLRTFILSLVGVFILCAVFSFGFYFSFFEANTVTSVFSSVTFLTLSFLGFKQLLNRPKGELLKMPVFYAISAFFIYYALTFLKRVFINYLVFELEISAADFFPISMLNLFANTSKNYTLFYVLVLMERGAYDPILKVIPKANGR